MYRNLYTMMCVMDEKSSVKEWLSSMTKRRITAVEIAEILGVSRTTVNTRITKGLSADDLITVCRSLCVNPVDALTELGYLAYDEVMSFQDSDGKLVDTATEGELSLELARRLNPAILAPEINAIESAARRATTSRKLHSVDGNVTPMRHTDVLAPLPDLENLDYVAQHDTDQPTNDEYAEHHNEP